MNIRVLDIASFDDAVRRIRDIHADPGAVPLMARKAILRPVLLSGIDNRAANIIKQEALSLGGEAAVNWQVSSFKRGTSDVLLLLTERQYALLVSKLSLQPFGLRAWGTQLAQALACYSSGETVLGCGRSKMPLNGKTLVMGILNVTPDSFSDGGSYNGYHRAVARAEEMAAQGADIIDVGGESTRPGARPVPVKEEIARVVPVIRAVVKKVKARVSVDTYKPAVAKAALEAGARLVNDITGLRYDHGKMAAVIRDARVPVVLMHMQGTPRTMQKNPHYKNVVSDIGDFFQERIEFARSRGIQDEQLVLDPGIGFGKTEEHNLELLKRIAEFRVFGRPLLIGASRKSFLGKVLGGAGPAGRVAASVAVAVWAADKGVQIVRVHDVRETAEALKTICSIKTH